jgi:hypothetical protein
MSSRRNEGRGGLVVEETVAVDSKWSSSPRVEGEKK